MSIATEISRIQTATGDIKTAITGKGVTVPVGSQIDDLPALITSIPSGGGENIPDDMTLTSYYINYGSHSVSSKSKIYDISNASQLSFTAMSKHTEANYSYMCYIYLDFGVYNNGTYISTQAPTTTKTLFSSIQTTTQQITYDLTPYTSYGNMCIRFVENRSGASGSKTIELTLRATDITIS